jgi:hypothetical protein
MSTFDVRAPRGFSFGDFARPRLRRLFSTVIEIFADAQRDARAAHELYPFAE